MQSGASKITNGSGRLVRAMAAKIPEYFPAAASGLFTTFARMLRIFTGSMGFSGLRQWPHTVACLWASRTAAKIRRALAQANNRD
jgi:hypothetical protein